MRFFILETSTEAFELPLIIAIILVGALIAIASIVALVMSIYLAVKYVKYNKQMTKANVAGKDVARELLDKNGLEKIKVVKASIFTAFMIGNSYSHYFKRIRLRGLIYKKASLTSVAIAGEKVGLALLDKEKDKDMVKRIRLLPIVNFGPFMFIPFIIIGAVLDFLVFSGKGYITLVFSCIGILFYVWAALLSVAQLKTEKKAQDKAIKILVSNNYLTNEEVEDAKELYKLYNINYILQIIISFLELIKEILKIALKVLQTVKGNKN